MTAEIRPTGYKLRRILKRHPSLMDELRRKWYEGASYHELSLYIWETTQTSVDPSTVREWLKKWTSEQ